VRVALSAPLLAGDLMAGSVWLRLLIVNARWRKAHGAFSRLMRATLLFLREGRLATDDQLQEKQNVTRAYYYDLRAPR